MNTAYVTQTNHVRTVLFQMVKDPVENTKFSTQIDGHLNISLILVIKFR